MQFNRLLNTDLGRIFISILLGMGVATLFRKVCTDKKCIIFNGPIIGDFDKKIYQYDGKCYKYKTVASKCDTKKRIIDVTSPPTEPQPKAGLF
jgi:hypothetical protein